MLLTRDLTLPSDLLDSRDYDDHFGCLDALTRHATTTAWRMADLVCEVGQDLTGLDSAVVSYLELSAAAIASMPLSEGDREQLKAAFLSHPAGAIATDPPILVMPLDRFDEMPAEQRRIVVAHELVHIDQALRGSLKFMGEQGQWWEGEVYPADVAVINDGLKNGDPVATVLYLGMPWEREAIERSEGNAAYATKLQRAWAVLIACRGDGEAVDRPHVAGAILSLLEHVKGTEGLDRSLPQQDIDAFRAVMEQMGHELTVPQIANLHAFIEHFAGKPLPSPPSPLDLEQGLRAAAEAMCRSASSETHEGVTVHPQA